MQLTFSFKHIILFWLALISQPVFCQLNDFNFSVSTTDETCSGNGSIGMTVSGITPNATVTYTLYEYPETNTPLAQTTTNSFENLDSGAYLVVATQTLDNLQNTQSADATINDATTTLDYEIGQASMGSCDTASLIVTILDGNAVSYELLSGPLTTPPQSSNTFDDLPEGTYVIRVYDSCNNALTKTFTLILANNTFMIGPVSLPTVLNTCDEITITNMIRGELEDGVLAYPITIDYIIYPPDGSTPITVSNTYNSGPSSQLEITENIGIFDQEVFNIQIIAEDQCGQIISIINEINPNPKVIMFTTPGFCGKNLNIQVSHFLPPYTLEFSDAPSDFDPIAYNVLFPGPYTEPIIIFGQEDASVPYGMYSVIVTDACGRSGFNTYEVEEEIIEPEVTASNNGCNPQFGVLSVTVPDRDIVSAIFTAVPDNFTGTPPIDISNSIVNGVLLVDDLPQGDYSLELIDECGNPYSIVFTIPEFSPQPLGINTTPNCATQTGTLRIASPFGDIETVMITEAPATFPYALPYDYSSEILTIGVFYVSNLPEGLYTIELTDTCGNLFVVNQFISAYQSNPSIYSLERNCGSFNLAIYDSDESVWDRSYWFQKYVPETNTWGHPYTGATYTEGTMPNSTNSIEIENEETIYNIFLTGTFRLIKAFQPYNNPNAGQRCFDVFAEFEISSDLVINGVYNLNCEGGTGPSDLLIDVIGVEPYHFSIVSPINIDNGNNNIFTNLSPGSYTIEVEDVCGSIETIIVNLEDLLPVVNIFYPADVVMCSDVGNTQATFDLSQQNAQILGSQNPDNFTITYHLSQNDADSGENPLPHTYENTSSPQTIYVRVIHNTLNVCYETTSFQLIVGDYPQLGADETISICDGSSATLNTNPGYSNYEWSTGETTSSIAVNTSGTYTVTASQNYSDFSCEATKTFTVNISGIATIENITLEDFSPNNNSISVEVSGLGDYEYSLDGINYQPNSYFGNLQTGEYTVYVRDINGCGMVTEQVYLLNYMKFFTPNGDGENEMWQILGAHFEPDLEISIYDRYGKLLTAFKGSDNGWNGNYNGHQMPSNDYWFVVERGNGKMYKGHFTLKR